MSRYACWLLIAMCGHAAATPVMSLDDIQLWAGAGPNSAAVAIDWDGENDTDQALVWGYRWQGSATGEDALRAVIGVDPRAFLKVAGFGGFGAAVVGLGYDLNDDGEFAISDNTLFDPTTGIADTTPSDSATPLPGDLYAEGWEDAFWHYGLRSHGGEWSSSQTGASQRLLTDGDWDSWALAVTLNYTEFATNLIAAQPPQLPGDFSADGQVDIADYTAWRDQLNQPGGTTQADYTVWQAAMLGGPLPGLGVPEPATGVLCLFALSARCFSAVPRRCD